MGKKKRRSAPATAAEASLHVEETHVREDALFRDEIDEELLDRDEIRFDGEPDSETDDDLQTENLLQLPDSDDEADSEEEELRERDFEEIEDELRVKDKAWGKKKAVYYNDEEGDEDDLDTEDEEELEEEEEREAMVLQKRLMSNLAPEDFETSRFTADLGENEGKESVLQADLTSMSKDEQLVYLLQNAPELPELIEEFKEKMNEAKEPLYPLLQLGRQKGTFSQRGHSYIEAKYKLNLLYCLNIGYYLMLHMSEKNKQNIKEHPVINRLLEIRKVFNLCKKADLTLEKEIENMLNVDKEELEEDGEETNKRKLSQSHSEGESDDMYEKYQKISEEKKKKKLKKKKGLEIMPEDPTLMNEEDEEKRGISFKIMKNKGLTPHRKKEQRNPRVKHRKKYDKALKKRRSQIPDYRKQEGSYGGEKTGIKSGLTRGTKLK